MRRTPRDERRRALGQNFLKDQTALNALARALPLDPARDTVVELGAGRGALTERLAARAARVVAVECDPCWARELRARAVAWPHVDVVEGDALAVPLPSTPFSVVASPPFNLGTALVRRLLADGHGLRAAALVLQLEAAQRLAARGRFAATWAPWFELRVLRRIPARAFRPVPRVDAAILLVATRRPPLLSPAAFAKHAALVDAVFAAPGRTVGTRLVRVVGPARARAMLTTSGVPPPAGPASVAPETWATLTRAATSQRGGTKLR
jgi:23S rRNA (adenine-N6)-dimethyltransferase